MNNTLKTLNEGFNKRYLLKEAKKKNSFADFDDFVEQVFSKFKIIDSATQNGKGTTWVKMNGEKYEIDEEKAREVLKPIWDTTKDITDAVEEISNIAEYSY